MKPSNNDNFSKEKETRHFAKPRLVAGFSEDDELEGVFLIQASSEKVFNKRRRKLQEITGFSDGGCGSYEKDSECDVWKIITSEYFDTVEDLKSVIESMRKYKWFFYFDSHIMLDGDYLFSDGKWFV